MKDYDIVFHAEWEKFVHEFVLNLKQREKKGINVKALNDWYALNVERWANIGETEGASLRGLDEPDFENEFMQRMRTFSFTEVPQIVNNRPWIKLGITLTIACFIPIYASLHIALPFTFIEVPMHVPILSGVLLALMGISITLPVVKKNSNADDERRRQAYKKQLVLQGEMLLRFYKEYEKK